MNRKLSFCLIGAVSLAGCGQPATPDANSGYVMNETTAESAESVAGTLVNLKVPNMHWGACAASVRGDLSKIAGIVDIQTDPNARTCSFKVTDDSVDYAAEIAKFAETNTHLADYSIE